MRTTSPTTRRTSAMAKTMYAKVKYGGVIVIKDGDTIFEACCDCYLVHAVKTNIDDDHVSQTFTRDERKTAALRREARKRGEKLPCAT